MSEKIYRGERLKSRQEIQRLFGKAGASLGSYPLRLVYCPTETPRGNYPLQVAFTVPKRRYKKAVERNRIKRLMREAFRRQKAELLAGIPAAAPQYAWMLVYIGKEELPYHHLERKMRKLIRQFLVAVQPPDQL